MTTSNKFLLSLDFGTGAGRCYLISIDGEVSFEEYHEWAYEYPEEAQPGGSEFDANQFWGILADLIQKQFKNRELIHVIFLVSVQPASGRGLYFR